MAIRLGNEFPYFQKNINFEMILRFIKIIKLFIYYPFFLVSYLKIIKNLKCLFLSGTLVSQKKILVICNKYYCYCKCCDLVNTNEEKINDLRYTNTGKVDMMLAYSKSRKNWILVPKVNFFIPILCRNFRPVTSYFRKLEIIFRQDTQ